MATSGVTSWISRAVIHYLECFFERRRNNCEAACSWRKTSTICVRVRKLLHTEKNLERKRVERERERILGCISFGH